MAILNKIPQYTLNKNKQVVVEPPTVYIDDIFDPLFNAEARSYLDAKYNLGPIGNTLAGYAEGIDNALLGQKDKWGMLGPGMGILSGFGRSMDKAGDFIIGGLTEGVNAFGHLLGSDVPIENPLHNIFVEDEDYTGKRLLAAMANSMSGLAGDTTIDESDLSGFGWNITGTALDLATDPGILGGTLARKFAPDAMKPIDKSYSALGASSKDILHNLGKNGFKSAVGEIGQLLSNYDDLMANISLDLTAPGLRPLLSKTLDHLSQLIGTSSFRKHKDMSLEEPDLAFKIQDEMSNDPNVDHYVNMANDLAMKYNITPDNLDTIDLYSIVSEINEKARIRDFKPLGVEQQPYTPISDLMFSKENTANYLQEARNIIAEQQKALDDEIKAFFNYENVNLPESPDNWVSPPTTIVDELLSPAQVVDNSYILDEVSAKLSDIYYNDSNLGGIGYGSEFLENYIKEYDEVSGSPIWDSERFLEDLDIGDSEMMSEGTQQFLRKEFEPIVSKTKSPVHIAKSSYATQATNKAAAKYITAEISNTLRDLKYFKYIPDSVKNLNDLVEYINNDEMLKKLLKKDKIFIEGILQIPSKLTKKGTIPNVNTYDIIKNTKKLVEFTDSLDKYNLNSHPVYGRLIDLGNTLKTNILEPLNFKTQTPEDAVFSSVDSADSLMTSNFNKLLDEHPNIFIKDGKFDFNKLNEFRKHFKNYEVQVNDDVKMSLEDFGYEIGDVESFKKAINRMSKFRTVNGKKEMVFTVKNPYYELRDLIGTKEAPKPLRKVFNFIFGGINEKGMPTRNMDEVLNRLNQVENNKIYGKNIISFTDTPTKYFTKDQTAVQTMVDLSTDIEHVYTQNLENSFVNKTTALDSTNYVKWLDSELSNDPTIKNDALIASSKEFADAAKFARDNGITLEEAIKNYESRDKRTLFQLIRDAEAVKPAAKNLAGYSKATLRMNRVKDVVNRASELMDKYAPLKNGKRDTSDIETYLTIRDALNGDIVSGKDYIQNLITSGGYSGAVFKIGSKEAKALEQAIIKNNALINKEGAEVMSLIKENIGKDEVWIGYCFNSKNLKIRKNIKKLYDNTSQLEDLVFQKKIDLNKYPKHKKFYEDRQDLTDFFDEMQNISQDLSKMLGFEDFSSDYFKHALDETSDGGVWLNEHLYKNIDIDDLHEISILLGNDLNIKGTFGARPYTRALRGNIYRYNRYADVFSTDLDYISKSTFSKGVFDNAHFQTYVDLFVNENFKIKNYAHNVDDLKRILHVKENGKYTGNLYNLLLIAPKINPDTGKIVGFTRFDKLSDAGLEKALKNPDTILVPTHVVDTLDRLCKKDMKMSNKVYRFINKNLTIPYKFASLANPGFLLGNMSDAYLKQATTMSQKYGTTMTEELANVGMSIRRVTILNNQFDEVFQKYLQSSDSLGKKLPPYARNYDYLRTSKGNQLFMEWFNSDASKDLLSDRDRKLTRLWLFLNNAQPSSVFSTNARDLEDLTDTVKNSKYDTSQNIFERVTLGTGKYNPKDFTTWGLFANNPVSSFTLNKSASIENYFRSACILNDLTHKYKGIDIADILGTPKDAEDALFTQLQVDLSEALNTMHHANFDYEDVTSFMNASSTFIPFPTFFLKNFVYWMEVLVDNPQYIDNAISIQEGLWSEHDDELETDEFKAEAKGRGAIPISSSGQNLSKLFKGIYKPTPLNSMFGAFGLLNDPLPDMAFRLHPALAPITRHLQDPEDVRYRPYSTDMYEKNIKASDKKFNELEYMFHRMNPYERAINTGLRTPAKIKKGEAQLSDFMPSVFQPDF